MVERRVRPANHATQKDLAEFKLSVENYRSEAREERHENARLITARLDTQDGKLTRINTALFANGIDNEFESRGVMTVMKRLDNHIDTICTIGKWLRLALLALVPVTAAIIGLLHELGRF